MKEKSELKKNDDKEETQKLKPESNPNKESQKKSEKILWQNDKQCKYRF